MGSSPLRLSVGPMWCPVGDLPALIDYSADPVADGKKGDLCGLRRPFSSTYPAPREDQYLPGTLEVAVEGALNF